ncbi:MAG: hypothetical protein COA78_28820 [Blastopirellula sp.]|nr:MAG: hypothetical protein COA78_28820 [Blastopirellula sp.]
MDQEELKRLKFVGKLFGETPLSRDGLPYTEDFALLCDKYKAKYGPISNHNFWRDLCRVLKAPKKFFPENRSRKEKSHAPKLTRQEQLEIIRLFPEGLGIRDRYPYTKEFDEVRKQFNTLTNNSLSKQGFWRCLVGVAKKSQKPKPSFEVIPTGKFESNPDLMTVLGNLNPWWQGKVLQRIPFFRRTIYDKAKAGLASVELATTMRGTRRVGKTTIQKQLIEELLYLDKVDPRNILSIEFDQLPSLGEYKEPLLAIVNWYETQVLPNTINHQNKTGESVYLFLDEVQNLKNWPAQVKHLLDNFDVHVFITGSSSLRIKRGEDSLAGRLRNIRLGTFSLSEIVAIHEDLQFKPFQHNNGLDQWKTMDFWLNLIEYGKKHHKLLSNAFLKYSQSGGFPMLHSNLNQADEYEKRDYIEDTVITRTLGHDTMAIIGKGWNPDLLRETFRIVCRYAGKSLSPKFIADNLSIRLGDPVKPKIVSECLGILEDALLINRIPSFDKLQRKQKSHDKLCLCDNFVREAFLQDRIPIHPDELKALDQSKSTQAGHLIESIIGSYLCEIPGLDISWFPERNNEPEVDFVLRIGIEEIPIEVKYRRKKPGKSELAGLQSFCAKKEYDAEFGIIITQEYAGLIEENILAIPAFYFLAVR